MPFSDFVEKVAGVPICRELKQYWDKWYELYKKDPENIFVLYPRGSGLTLSRSFIRLLLGLYEEGNEERKVWHDTEGADEPGNF